MATLAVISQHRLFAAAILDVLRVCPRLRPVGVWRSLAEAERSLAVAPDALLFLVPNPPGPGEEAIRLTRRLWPRARLVALAVESNLAWRLDPAPPREDGPAAESDRGGGAIAPLAPETGCDLGSLLLAELCPLSRGQDCPLAAPQPRSGSLGSTSPSSMA